MRQRIVKPRRRVEDTLQTHCAKLLAAYQADDVCWFAVPNGGKRPKRAAWLLKQMGVIPGAADLIVLKARQCNAVELKSDGGTQSDDQIAWQERFERAGGRYYLARSLGEALIVLQSRIGAFRPDVKISEAKVLA